MYKRIVVKIGTRALSDTAGNIDSLVLKQIVNQIASLKKMGIEVVLVTSGAVGAGKSIVKLKTKDQIVDKQLFASIGQVKLMNMYSDFLGKHGLLCAQILVTKEDFRDRQHYLNMRRCFENLLLDNVVPIVNENDVVATTELFFTDNDELAGLVASQLNVDATIILTSVDGIFETNNKNKKGVVSEIETKSYESVGKFITKEKTASGRGGMLTKFGIAKKLALQGIAVHIANGKTKNILTDIIRGKHVGTKFIPEKKSSSIKRRLAYSEGVANGSVVVNKCAEDMLVSKTKAMSLLPVGISKVSGSFEKGDIIEIKGSRGTRIGFGVAQYDFETAAKLCGKKNAKPVIHYNYMFIYG